MFDYRVSDRPFTDMVVKPISENFDGLPRLCRQVERFLSPADELLDAAGFAVIQTYDDVGIDHLLRLTLELSGGGAVRLDDWLERTPHALRTTWTIVRQAHASIAR